MSNAAAQEQHGQEKAPASIDRSTEDTSSGAGGARKKPEADQYTDTRLSTNDGKVADGTLDDVKTHTGSLDLQDIGHHVTTKGLALTLDQLPEPNYLGGTDSSKVWARLKMYSSKPDEVELVYCSFLFNTSQAAYDPSRLTISIYPFSVLAKDKENLIVLVRYVFSEAARDGDIGEAIEKAGDVDKLLNIHPPSKLLQGFSYMESPPISKATKSAEVSDPSEAEIEVYRPRDTPSERQIFVPNKTNPKKAAKSKVQQKSKALPMAVVEKNTPVQDSATGAHDGTETKAKVKVDDSDDLEDERKEIEEERAEISKRRADREREEMEDAKQMKDVETRRKKVEREETKLLKGKIATWLLAYQRQHKKV
ncbi:uncharacterized protein M421DRAFT_4837 [Didymella exigua CBS 183.55]|uniref:Uncharacterized protein n=1 Tax=Didymella exigua CBS 183.55 TaxID=1150837 RepID=A0A6A5RPE2_9PLEO|nr:uncharacterized protein M421DRAFT_4837 [Didymella exigua CBS 183.55]KAF1929018.1 hypothetical protein M421DRAFT_4837 [Didymella exigua CBS 183.55]